MAVTGPTKTGIPYLVNTDIANGVDFHIASTDFHNIIDEYANHITAMHLHNWSKSTYDPITKEAQFFERLNSNLLNTAEGWSNAFGNDGLLEGYKLSKLGTLLNVAEIWVRGDDGLPVTRSRPIFGETGEQTEYYALNLQSGERRWIQYTDDTEEVIRSSYNNMSQAWGTKKMTDEFLLYWYEKYQRAHKKVKEEYRKLIGPENENYFTDFSDSIGLLGRAFEVVDSRSVPFIDVNFSMMSTLPCDINSVTFDKMDRQAKSAALELGKKANTLFRMNTIGLINFITTIDEAHGENLQVDYYHWTRILKVVGDVNGIIADTLGNAFRLMSYMQVAQNSQQIISPKINMVVENSMIEVDFLKNKIQALTKLTTNDDVLKSTRADKSID